MGKGSSQNNEKRFLGGSNPSSSPLALDWVMGPQKGVIDAETSEIGTSCCVSVADEGTCCMFIFVSLKMKWRPIQVVPRLHPGTAVVGCGRLW